MIYHRFDDCMMVACFSNGFYHRLSLEASELLKIFENHIIDDYTISRLKDVDPVAGSNIETFINNLVNFKLILTVEITESMDLPHAAPDQFTRFTEAKRLELQTHKTMTHVLALKDIYNVDEKGWPVLNNG